MKPVWSKQPKYIKIRGAKKPIDGYHLSGIVLVVDEIRGVSYISFDIETVRAIGKKMPYGIGADHQAYLKVLKKERIDGSVFFEVECKYLDMSRSVLLWVSDSQPSWIKRRHETNY